MVNSLDLSGLFRFYKGRIVSFQNEALGIEMRAGHVSSERIDKMNRDTLFKREAS